jgi:hypothetical protein
MVQREGSKIVTQIESNQIKTAAKRKVCVEHGIKGKVIASQGKQLHSFRGCLLYGV